jgi:hypothetical protein
MAPPSTGKRSDMRVSEVFAMGGRGQGENHSCGCYGNEKFGSFDYYPEYGSSYGYYNGYNYGGYTYYGHDRRLGKL